MKCLRIPWLLILVTASTVAAAQDQRPERLVLYVDEDLPRNHELLQKIASALTRSGTASRHRVRLELLPAEPSNKESLAPVLRRGLNRRPAVIIASNSNVALVAKGLTADVPIVFASHQDPIAVGLAESLARPGRNLTGFTYFVPIDPKRLELLRTVVPAAKRLGIVIDRWWLSESAGDSAVAIAREKFGFEVTLFPAETQAELQKALATPKAREMQAWYVPYTRLAYERPDVVIDGIQAMHKPAIYPTTRFVVDGGLLSYQQVLSLEEIVDLLATMVGLVLDGVPTREIPVERPKAFELAVNFTTARTLGLKVPQALLKRANRVIADKVERGSQ